MTIQSDDRQQTTDLKKDLAAIAFIAALVLLFFWRVITPRLEDRAAFPPGDFTDQFWAFRMYEARAFAQGRLPLWSENFNGGHPFLADVQSAIFYPVSLLWTLAVVALRGANFTLLDLEIEAIFHFILAGAFTYLFAKRLLSARIPALVSALTFTFGGYLTSYPPLQLAILETAAWLPLILLLLDYAVARGTSYYVVAGLVLGVAALAGHPQTFLFVGYTAVIYFAWRVFQRRITTYPIPFFALRFALIVVIAAGIACAQWIPSIEYQMVSTRAAISWSEASRGFPALDPLQMILPGFASAFQSPLYVGILGLWLGLFALWVKRSREKIFWIWLALGSLIVSFGAYVFAYALFYLFVPGFALFRGQERLAFVVSFSLAMLAGYGMRDLQSNIDLKRARRVWALLPAGVVVSAMLLFTLYIGAREFQTGRLFFLTDRAAFMLLLFVLASVLVAWRIRLTKWEWAFPAIAIGFILFDLFSINTVAFNADSKSRYPQTPLIETIHADADRDVFRVVDEGTQPGHFGIAYNLEEIGGISPLRIARYAALLDRLPEEHLWRLLNVRYVLTKRPGFDNAQVVAQEGETRLLRLQNVLPRAWFVTSAQANTDDQTALEAMARDTFDPRQVAYLADELSLLQSPDAVRNSARVIVHEPERLVIAVDAPVESLLVVSQVYYPLWNVRIDGVPVQTRRADVALIAVPVQKGAKQVELIFDSRSAQIGIAISLLTFFAAIFLMSRTRSGISLD